MYYSWKVFAKKYLSDKYKMIYFEYQSAFK